MAKRLPSIQDRNTSGSPSGIEEVAAQYNFDSFADRLHYLHGLLITTFDNTESHLTAYLEAGQAFFGTECSWLLNVSEAQATYVQTLPANAKIVESESSMLNLDQFDCWTRSIAENQTPVATIDCKNTQPSELSYNGKDVYAYLGAPIVVSGQFYGVLSFISSTPRQAFTSIDIETVELMAKGVAKMTELQRLHSAEEAKLPPAFVTAGVKTFEEYVQQARLPEVYGIPGRVVEVLERRIGKSALAIDYIAEELNLSKRTLQRRLQQQCISFAQLRDQVRFHHSIYCLIEQNMSIDSISASLDFSDRTSFTNAFKRWTGLSPSTFRKLFRDYA
jgi:AraC-like DNA-binding protein